MKVSLHCGIGDCIAGTSFIDFYGVTEVYWATNAYQSLKPIFQNLFPHIAHYALNEAFAGAGEVRWAADLVEWSPLKFDEVASNSTYRTSPLMAHQLAEISRFNLPDSYVVIQPYTLSIDHDRDFLAKDWANTLLSLGDRVGVVVDKSYLPIPDDPRLINLQRQTTFAEGVEIVKQASAFIGIDSCFSILACQLSYPMQVRTRNAWYEQMKHIYCAPRKDFSFVRGRISPIDIGETGDSPCP